MSRQGLANLAGNYPSVQAIKLTANRGWIHVPETFVDQVARCAVDGSLTRSVHEGKSPVAVKGEKALGDAVQNDPALVLTRFQGFFNPLAVGYVSQRTVKTCDPPGRTCAFKT